MRSASHDLGLEAGGRSTDTLARASDLRPTAYRLQSGRRARSLAACTLAFPGLAHAHLVTTGLGPFYDGITHFVITLEDLLPAVALALLAGLQGARAGRAVLFAMPAAWLIAGCAAMVRPVEVSGPALAASLLVGVGSLVALDRRVPARIVTVLALLLGSTVGYLSASSIAVEADLSGVALLGATTALFTIVALVAAAAVAASRPPLRIATRVAGSWLAAIGLMQFALSINSVG